MAEQILINIMPSIESGHTSKLKSALSQIWKEFDSGTMSIKKQKESGEFLEEVYKRIYTSAGKLRPQFVNIGVSADAMKTKIAQLKNVQEQFNKTSNDTAKSSHQARTALLSVSQAIQDAPYGIRGMSNNIDFLMQQFLVLRTTSGTTGKALKDMFSALASPSGFLIVFSAISALINYFSNLKETSEDAMSSLKDSLDIKVSLGLITYTESINELTLALQKFEEEAGRATWLEILGERLNVLMKLPEVIFTSRSMEQIESHLRGTYPSKITEEELKKSRKDQVVIFKQRIDEVELLKSQLEIKKKGKELDKEDYLLLIKKTGTLKDIQKLGLDSDLSIKVLQKTIEFQKKIAEIGDKKIKADKKNQDDSRDALLNRIKLIFLEGEITGKNSDWLVDNIYRYINANDKDLLTTEDKYEIQKKIVDKINEEIDLKLSDEDKQKERNADLQKLLNKQDESLSGLQKQRDEITKLATLEEYIAEIRKDGVITDEEGKKAKDLADIDNKIKKIKKDAPSLGKTFEKVFQEASRDMARSFSQDFYQSMENKMNGINSVFEKMVVAFGQALIEMEIMALASTVFSLLSGGSMPEVGQTGSILLNMFGFAKGGYINEPVMGVGASGRGYMFGERGREMVISSNRISNNMNSSSMATNGVSNVIVTGKLKGRDIYLSNLRENNNFSRMSY